MRRPASSARSPDAPRPATTAIPAATADPRPRRACARSRTWPSTAKARSTSRTRTTNEFAASILRPASSRRSTGRTTTTRRCRSPSRSATTIACSRSATSSNYLDRELRRFGAGPGSGTVIAGNAEFGFCGDGGPARDACLAYPNDVAIGPDGAIYVSDGAALRVRRIADGVITTVAGNGELPGRGRGTVRREWPCRRHVPEQFSDPSPWTRRARSSSWRARPARPRTCAYTGSIRAGRSRP